MSSVDVVLISPLLDISALSLRVLSSCLKVQGFKTRMIFLSNVVLSEELDTPEWDFTYPPEIVDQVFELCEDARLIGISLMTNNYHCMAHLTKELKRRGDVPVVWGGTHATLRPQDCLKHADFVCVGEGEEALVELTTALSRGVPTDALLNIYTTRDGRMVSNPLRPLINDLDALPFQDYDLHDHYIYRRDEQRIVGMTSNLLDEYLSHAPRSSLGPGTTFQVTTTRGCPYRCAYCANKAISDLYPGQAALRRRSDESVVAEIKAFIVRFPFTKTVMFTDDSFLSAPADRIKRFCGRYREEIGLPFRCLTAPASITPSKMYDLANAGLFFMEVGIQTGSDRINRLYNRSWASPETVLEAANTINLYRDRVMPLYDIILDNPYCSKHDELQTMELVLKLPPPYMLQIFSLSFYPGTELLEKALSDGLVESEQTCYLKDYRVFRRTYANMMYVLLCRGLPSWFVRFLARRPMMVLFDRRFFEQLFSGLVAVKQWLLRLIGRMRAAVAMP